MILLILQNLQMSKNLQKFCFQSNSPTVQQFHYAYHDHCRVYELAGDSFIKSRITRPNSNFLVVWASNKIDKMYITVIVQKSGRGKFGVITLRTFRACSRNLCSVFVLYVHDILFLVEFTSKYLKAISEW